MYLLSFSAFCKPSSPCQPLCCAMFWVRVCEWDCVWVGPRTLYVICGHTLIVNVSCAVMCASCLSSTDCPGSACQVISEKKTHLSIFPILFPTALFFSSGFVHGVLAEDWRLLPRSTSTRLNPWRMCCALSTDFWMHWDALPSTTCGPATQNSSQI